jgi:hypothetical protein
MFTIKVFRSDGSYMAFSSRRYEYSPMGPTAHADAHGSIHIEYDDGKYDDVLVTDYAFIENQAGKTIARIGSEPQPRLENCRVG